MRAHNRDTVPLTAPALNFDQSHVTHVISFRNKLKGR